MLTQLRYHGKCLKIARGKVKEDDKYTCPICDYRVKIPRDAARPKLEDLIEWEAEIPSLPFIPDEMDCLHRIIEGASKFRQFVSSYTNSPIVLTTAEVPTMRFYLRKIEGAEILLSHETNFFRQELHRCMPIAPDPPPMIEISQSTRKPRPTKQQKIMAQMGIKNPEELPPQYRTKQHVFNKKKPELNGKPTPPMPIKPAPIRGHGSPSPSTPKPDQMYEYSRYGSATARASPTYSQTGYGGSPGSPVLVNNPGRGQTLDPALFNPAFHGHRPTTASSSNSPSYNSNNSREVNNIFDQLTNHDSPDLFKESSSGPANSGYESLAAQALDQTSSESLDRMADQFLHRDP
jgi:histone demethylase JARID1